MRLRMTDSSFTGLRPPETFAEADLQQERAVALRQSYADRFLWQGRAEVARVLEQLASQERERLALLRQSGEAGHVQNPSVGHPTLTFSPVGRSCQWVLQQDFPALIWTALSFHDASHPFVFCAVFDYAWGFADIATRQSRAEALAQLAGTTQHGAHLEACLRQLQAFHGDSLSPGEARAREEALLNEERRCGELARRDSTGRALLSELVARLKRRCGGTGVGRDPISLLAPYQTSAFVLAGGTFAEKLCVALATEA